MVRVRFTQADGSAREIVATIGDSLMASAKAQGVDGIEAECGGSMVCGTCHVYIADCWLDRVGQPTAMEAEMLEFGLYPQANSRLSCQVPVTAALDGIEVGVPPSQR